MPNRVFIIADLHIGHANVLKFEPQARPFGSIEEHDEELIYRCNHVVKPKDTLWILGDVVFGQHNLEKLARLNGHKHLVMGNHDHFPSSEYLKYFSRLHGCTNYRDFILTHVPVHPMNIGRFKGNIHGHLHSHTVGDPNYVCVSAEQQDLTPKLLDTVIHEFDQARQLP